MVAGTQLSNSTITQVVYVDNKFIMSEGGGFYAWLDGVMGVVYYTYFRPLMKWFLRATTRLCELQRVCYGQTPGAQRTISVGEITACTTY